ncbi:MAG TPA: CHASE3 domain-containing protein, partial [Actinomycetes bacterium]|nr:CHASE3 domain-containing protein [Actinomycetes bacterium]
MSTLRRQGGLTGRMLIASGLLALLVGAAFAVLLSSVADLRALERRARRSEEVLAVANVLERQVVDLETAQRGFVITRQGGFLEPWRQAQLAFPADAATLERLLGDDPAQQARARRIVELTRSYLRDYSIPLIARARRDPAAVATVVATDQGRRRMDAIRDEFTDLLAA